ncbi:MAG: class I SAM-dependent methyltransferase [bacterium]
MTGFKDYFSRGAANYALFRPTYPAELFRWLGSEAQGMACAWDCATGSGQAALALAEHFDRVVATDPSHAQLRHAGRHDRITYAAMTAEDTALRRSSVQLVTVAQAAHWFHLGRFYDEVRRVVEPGGMVAMWSYGLLTIDQEIDQVVRAFYTDEVGRFWPAERAIVDAGLSGVAFPFIEMTPPQFAMEASWRLDQFAGYVSTWSAVTRYIAALGNDPIPGFIDRLRPLWGREDQPQRIRWPLDLRAGRVSAM